MRVLAVQAGHETHLVAGHLEVVVARVLGDGVGVDLLGSGEVPGLDGLAGGPLHLGLLGLGFSSAGAGRAVDGDGAVDTVGGRHLQQLVDDGAQLLLGHRPLEHRHRLARDEGHHRGDGLSLEGLGDLRGRIHVDARQLETAGVLIGELLQDRGEVGTGLAARAVQDDDDRHLGGDLGDVAQGGGVDVDHERDRQTRTGSSSRAIPGGGARGGAGRAGRLSGGGETGQVDGAEHAHSSSAFLGPRPDCFMDLGLSVFVSAGAVGRPHAAHRPGRASGPTPSSHGAGPGTGGGQDGLADADAVGAGVLESSRSTFISAVSAPRTVTFPPLPSLGMEKATMES